MAPLLSEIPAIFIEADGIFGGQLQQQPLEVFLLHVEIAHFLNSLRDGENDLRRNIFPRTGHLKRFAA